MKELVIKHFDHGASQYSRHAVIQKEIALKLLNDTVNCVSNTQKNTDSGSNYLFKRCLDLGCGPGVNYSELKQYAEYVVGADLSPVMVEEALKLNIPGTESFVADMEQLQSVPKITGYTYDFIFSSLAMQWCNITTVLNQITGIKKYREYQTVALSLPLCGTLPELRSALKNIGAGDRTYQFTDFEHVCTAAKKILGSNINVSKHTFTDKHSNIKSYLEAIRSIGANTTSQHHSLSKSQYRDLMLYLQGQLTEHGYLSHTYPVVFIYGTI
ncbi:methyltransferase domain-containing protein [Ruminobacter sp. RM87]|uniref:methyltransferase domain-containing protein n=1 Tax=Ruminobacter sp. RM87 TaxID=1200567 RepID=UPI0004E21E6C|nr:methyltransferase domain-containing protein [Ruminobacter sp. RM87]